MNGQWEQRGYIDADEAKHLSDPNAIEYMEEHDSAGVLRRWAIYEDGSRVEITYPEWEHSLDAHHAKCDRRRVP